jgi:hypothetical protein
VRAMAISWIVFVLVFGSAIAAIYLHRLLPEHHVITDSKDVVKLAIALIATMAALVLSLLISSAKSSYDTRSNQVVQMSAEILVLDRLLAHYGAEAADARNTLHQTVLEVADRIWPEDGAHPAAADYNQIPVDELYDKVATLQPADDAHRTLRSEAVPIVLEIGHTLVLLKENMRTSIPLPFLGVLVFWLCIIFASFGLFAPRNATVIAVLGVCALSASCAIFLILELDRSFEGLLQVSGVPFRAMLAQLGR